MNKIYDIIPPQYINMRKNKKPNQAKTLKGGTMKFVVLLLVICLNGLGLSTIITTVSYLFDTETSLDNLFAAGSLDFVLDSPADFAPSLIAPGESTSREINFLNTANLPKYKVRTDGFTGELCDYLKLEASLDGAASVSSDLIGFTSPIVDFVDPDDWSFKLTLPADAPDTVQGQTCQFKFVFDGSQTENDLPFGQGFNDTEEISNNISAKICQYYGIRSMGYWKTHPSVYVPHLPQFLGAPGEDSIIGNQAQANQIFLDYNLSMRDKLNGQLLAMKFNIAHFGIGEYFVESQGKTLNEIVAEADDLLRDASTPNDVLEDMKNLLDYLNNLHQIRVCSAEPIEEESTEGTEPNLGIVINEILPNPAGNDNASMPGGEWVELYNKTDTNINVAGWWLYDSADGHDLAITNNNTNTGNTIVSAGGFLVVYRNGDNNFVLNNTGGDSVRLYDGKISDGANLIDSYTYTIDALEGKSIVRFPDGSDTWVDPIPTPGEPNTSEVGDVVFGPAIAELDELEETAIESNGTGAGNTTIFEEALNTIENLIDNLVGENQAENIIPEEAAIEEPVIEESATEETNIIDEPIIEMPIEEPVAEEPFLEEPSEPVIEQPVEQPTENIENTTTETPTEISTETPVELPTELPVE